MIRRILALAATVALFASACGAGPDPSADGAIVSARPLAYSLTGDVDLGYRVDLDMQMTTTFGEGWEAVDSSVPRSMNMTMEMGYDSRYRVQPGEDPGTYRVALVVENLELGSGSIDMGPESFSFADLPQDEIDTLLGSQVAEVTFLVDDRGEVLSMEVAGQVIDVGGILGGTSPVGGTAGQMFGPEFPEGAVQVGDSWTTISEQRLPGLEPIVTEERHTIAASEERNGHDTWVIKTEATTAAYTITWEDLMAIAESLGGAAAIGADEVLPAGFRMSMRSAPTGATLITWFDPSVGLTIAQEVMSSFSTTIEMAGAPGTGGLALKMDVAGYLHTVMELKN